MILTGALKPGEKVFSVREMSQMLAINPNTIQKAFRELESEGYICSVQGKGSFVAEDAANKTELVADQLKQQLNEIIREFIFWRIPVDVPLSIIKEAYAVTGHSCNK